MTDNPATPLFSHLHMSPNGARWLALRAVGSDPVIRKGLALC